MFTSEQTTIPSVRKAVNSDHPLRVVICGGGTGGHVTPGIAIAESILENTDNADVAFLGHADQAVQELVGEAGFRWHQLGGPDWSTKTNRLRIHALASVLPGVLAARRYLIKTGCGVVVGLGGYSSIPGIIAARLLGLPIVIHESNSQPGAANYFLSRFADHVFVASENVVDVFRARAAVSVAGVPVRAAIRHCSVNAADRYLSGVRRIVVTTGSVGSDFLNSMVPALLDQVQQEGRAIFVTHQSGRGDTASILSAYRSFGIECEVVHHLADLAEKYSRSDLVISSAGAVTLAELSFVKRPALVVASSKVTADHQQRNASSIRRPWTLAVTESCWNVNSIAQWISEHLATYDDHSAMSGFESDHRCAGSTIAEYLQQVARARI